MDQALIIRRRMNDNNPNIIIYWDSSSVLVLFPVEIAWVVTARVAGVVVSAYGLSS